MISPTAHGLHAMRFQYVLESFAIAVTGFLSIGFFDLCADLFWLKGVFHQSNLLFSPQVRVVDEIR
jgi:hypothetical protein